MSNFTQTQPIQYRPYVATQPVELMANIGVQREQQLQDGIQKVNSYVSSVAGLDVLRDVDKNHLQSKLSELKQGVTDNLSGDFSDQRIVGQIAGAASQIYKDPQIQNAVSSTLQVRKGQQEMDAARKEGKNGPANDSYFNNKVNSYLQDTDPHGAFNYQYEKYVDVNKNIFDIVGKLLPSGTTIDEAFTPDGKLADYVLRNGFKGVKPDQIKAALRQGLNPQDWRQLELDGIYNYSNVPPEQFAKNVQERYSGIAKQYQDKIDLIDSANTNSAYEKAQLKNTRSQLTEELDRLKQEYEGVTSQFQFGDTDAGKAKLYTMDKINGMAAALSHGEITKTITGDTPQQMAKWRSEQNTKIAEWSADFQQRNLFHQDDMNEKKLTRLQKEKELNPLRGSVSIPFNKQELPQITSEKLIEDNHKLENDINLSKNEFIKDQGISEEAYNQAAQDYVTSPAKLNAIQYSHFAKQAEKQVELNGQVAFVSNIIKEADANKDFKKLNEFIPQGAKDITISERVSPTRINQTTFSPIDFVNFNKNADKYIKIVDQGEGGISLTYDLQKAQKELPEKQFRLLQIQAKKNSDNPQPLNETELLLNNYSKNYYEAVNKPHLQELKRKDEYITQKIQDGLLMKSKSSTGFNLATPAAKDAAKSTLAELADLSGSYAQGKIGNATKEDLLALASDDDKVMTMTSSEGNKYQEPSYTLHVKGKIGAFDIPLSQEQVKEKWGNQFRAPETDRNFQNIDNRIQMAGGNSTKLGPTPYLQKNNFTNVNNYGIQGDVLKDKNTGLFLLDLKVHDPITQKVVNITFPAGRTATDKAGILKAIQGLDDSAIFQLLNSNNTAPTQAQLKELETAAQKPF